MRPTTIRSTDPFNQPPQASEPPITTPTTSQHPDQGRHPMHLVNLPVLASGDHALDAVPPHARRRVRVRHPVVVVVVSRGVC